MDFMRELSEIRVDINEVDRQIGKLFEQRMDLAKEVAIYKQAKGLPVFDGAREKQVLEDRVKPFAHKEQQFQEALKELYQKLMDLSKEEQVRLIERPVEIGYYGVKGSFTHEAYLEMFRPSLGEEFSGVDGLSFQTFDEIFKALSDGKIKYGIVPVENSLTGIINEVYDLLGTYDFYIIREWVLPIRQNLLGVKGASMSQIKEVYSHPQGFAQSSEFLAGHPEWKLVPFYNTSRSAEEVSALQDPQKACIAGLQNAERYGLELLAENIQNDESNFTRFVVISPTMDTDPQADKISLYFTLQHRPGSLFDALRFFEEAGLNLLRIESRPIKGHVWEYAFFVDIEGNLKDEKVTEAISKVRDQCHFMKILGNYKKL